MEILGESDLDNLDKEEFNVDDEMGPNSMKKNARKPLVNKNQTPPAQIKPKVVELQNFHKEKEKEKEIIKETPQFPKSKLPQIHKKDKRKKPDLGENQPEEEQSLISKGNNNNKEEVEEVIRDDIPLWE